MLQSPLASAFRVAFNLRFTMPGDLFPNIDRVNGVACPVFIIHGTRREHQEQHKLDTRLPALVARLRGPSMFVGGSSRVFEKTAMLFLL